MIHFRVTYDIVIPESAEDGDTAENGWFHRGGWKFSADDEPSQWTLHELVSQFGRGTFEDSGTWFSSASADQDYRTGEDTSYAVHPPRNITAASYKRIRRILCGR